MENVFKIINIEKINSKTEAIDFINQLTDHDTPLREAVAYKLEDIVKDDLKYFLDDFSINKILKAIVDINPNVSRTMCNILKDTPKLKELLEDKIIMEIEQILSSIDKKEHFLNTKSHAKNKIDFALYWYLEALSICQSLKNREKILKILKTTVDFSNYTIREKTAKILSCMDSAPQELLQKAKQDDNFYVKMQVYDKMNFEIET